ncbi:MULE transposase [Hirsutella rhossiliensis]|uniref:MULE transposase domain-containing protein n=1 Tax=Hirsutella rhossiliensis TaxID=111463 RepID=A0A9P8MSJ7_9HYPO|nr:MULE transposase domain-containing protein [Hirsutella rhossiliensis]KAH0960384.1 MULE transposase domain-containing protein [Hirsutella rhossiliensis]
MTPAITHSKYRAQLIADNLDHIIHLYNGGLKPALITCQLRGLCQNPEHDPDLKFLLAQHIRNAIALYRTQELAGRTPLQFLYDQLKDPSLGFFFRDTRDQEGRLTGLSSHRAPASSFGSVIRMSSFGLYVQDQPVRMPLLNVCGSTAEKMTFSIAAVFLSGEAEPHYRWSLQCLLELAEEEGIPMPRVIVTDRELALMKAIVSFPALRLVICLLCRWHVNKNVLANCKAYFPKAKRDDKNRVIRDPKFTTFLKEWHSLVNAPDEAAYEQRLQTFKEPGRHPEAAIAYAVNTWLDRWKEKIVLCFVNRVRHLGHTTTSIVEGMHASMKRFLWTSTGDLTSVFQRFKAF